MEAESPLQAFELIWASLRGILKAGGGMPLTNILFFEMLKDIPSCQSMGHRVEIVESCFRASRLETSESPASGLEA